MICIYNIHIKMSIRKIQKRLQRLNERHQGLLKDLLNPPPMLRGSFSCVSTRCGKPTCWCAQSVKGHRHNRLTWSERGKMRTRKVPEEQVDRIKELTGRYRLFRQHRRELHQVQKQLIETIAKLESAVNAQTRKPISYLAITPKTAPQTRAAVRKTRSKKNSTA